MRWGLGDSPEAQGRGRALSGFHIFQGVSADCMNRGGAQVKALTVEKPPGTQRAGTPSAGSVVGLVARAEEEYS